MSNPRCQICNMRHDPPLCQRLADGCVRRGGQPGPAGSGHDPEANPDCADADG